MATERGYTDAQFNKLVAEVKKNPGNSERHYANVSGIAMGQIGKALYAAEVVADPSLKIPATGKAIVAARNKGVRWPRIAARTGLGVAKVKEMYEAESGSSAAESWTGRGRRFDGGGSNTSGSKKSSTSRGASKKTGTSGRRGASKTASASRGSTKKTQSARDTRGTRGTRASATPNNRR